MPSNRIAPGPGQESVWDYPRPPRCEDCSQTVKVEAGGIVLAESVRSKRVLETSHPPVYYIPPEDIRMDLLRRTGKQSWCEWKGTAVYYDLVAGDRTAAGVAWAYPDPSPAFRAICDHLAFYPHEMDACFVDDEQVQAQAGGFYGGWITSKVVGPFKGERGTRGW